MADPQQHGYRAYLLRLWQVNHQGELTWRASLEHPHTGERHSFATLDGLFAYLADPEGQSVETEVSPTQTQ